MVTKRLNGMKRFQIMVNGYQKDGWDNQKSAYWSFNVLNPIISHLAVFLEGA